MEFADLDLSKSYTYADYLRWKLEDRLELIKGKIFKMSPAPGATHQRISQRLNVKLYNYLTGKQCEVFTAPFDVRLFRTVNDEQITTVVQPDLCVICDPVKIDERGCLGAPDIVIEILSPGNNKQELQHKYDVYEEAGVWEYWIIHPAEKTFFKYVLVNKRFQGLKPLTTGDQITTDLLPGFVMDIEDLFQDAR